MHCPRYTVGAVLAPWPNRVADGRYTYAGELHQLPLTEPERATALHGLVVWQRWKLLAHSESRVALTCSVWPQPGYPFKLELEVVYALSADGLTIELAAQNGGSRRAPYGCSIHPYLVAGGGAKVDDWYLLLPADEYLEVEPSRLLPTAQLPVAGSRFDFRTIQQIGSRRIDHALTELDFSSDRRCVAYLLDRVGVGVQLRWDDSCRWIQVHTADRPEPELNRAGLALEPMTCPPNALVTGEGLIELAPGECSRTWWHVSAVENGVAPIEKRGRS